MDMGDVDHVGSSSLRARWELMTEDLLARLQPIFRDVFDDDGLQVEGSTTAANVDGWDSFSHIRLVLAVEQAFGVKFSAREINKLKNVSEFCDLIQSKL